MLQQLRQTIGRLGGRQVEADPMVKVAGVPSHQEAESCLEALVSQGLRAQIREEPEAGGFALWTPASQEPRARVLLGLSGHSVIRLRREKPQAGKGKAKGKG